MINDLWLETIVFLFPPSLVSFLNEVIFYKWTFISESMITLCFCASIQLWLDTGSCPFCFPGSWRGIKAVSGASGWDSSPSIRRRRQRVSRSLRASCSADSSITATITFPRSAGPICLLLANKLGSSASQERKVGIVYYCGCYFIYMCMT